MNPPCVPCGMVISCFINELGWYCFCSLFLSFLPGTPASQIPQAVPNFTAAAFAGPMILNGSCVSGFAGLGAWADDYAAVTVLVNYKIDPFTQVGQKWIRQLRNATGGGGDGLSTGRYFIASEGANQMDAAAETFSHLPLMIGLMMAAVRPLIYNDVPSQTCTGTGTLISL